MNVKSIISLAGGLTLAASMLSATTTNPSTYTESHLSDVDVQLASTQMARGEREPAPGDDPEIQTIARGAAREGAAADAERAQGRQVSRLP